MATQYRRIKEAYIPDLAEGATRKYSLTHSDGKYYIDAHNGKLKKESYGGGYTTWTTEIFNNQSARIYLDAGRWSQKKADALALQWEQYVAALDAKSPNPYL